MIERDIPQTRPDLQGAQPSVTQLDDQPASSPVQKSPKRILTHAERLAAKRAENLRQNLLRRKEQARSRQQSE